MTNMVEVVRRFTARHRRDAPVDNQPVAYRVEGTFDYSSTSHRITNVAVFDSQTGARLFSHQFEPIHMVAGDSIAFTVDKLILPNVKPLPPIRDASHPGKRALQL